MKKFVALILALLMVIAATAAFAADVKVVVNGEEIAFDTAPARNGESVWIPYRFVAEKIGAKVSWHQETKTVFTEYNGSIITTQIGNNLMFVNDKTFTLENAPEIVADRTMVSGEVFENALGATVAWDEETSTVTITTAQ